MTTQHTHEVVFGRKVDGCPRCDELRAGAKPVRWNVKPVARVAANPPVASIRKACSRGCVVCCTCGDW